MCIPVDQSGLATHVEATAHGAVHEEHAKHGPHHAAVAHRAAWTSECSMLSPAEVVLHATADSRPHDDDTGHGISEGRVQGVAAPAAAAGRSAQLLLRRLQGGRQTGAHLAPARTRSRSALNPATGCGCTPAEGGTSFSALAPSCCALAPPRVTCRQTTTQCPAAPQPPV